MRRAAAPLLEARMLKRWCGTIWPTSALAQDAGMSLTDYAAFVERALFLDRADPVAAWRELGAFQAGLVERLTPAQEIRVEAEGTDLRLAVGGRTWVNSDGKHNMPSGEVFTGPIEDSAQGVVRFTIPSGPAGVVVSGVELEFRAGEVVRATAEQWPGVPRPRARDRSRRPAPGRARDRDELRHRSSYRHDPVRREDRRHRAPRPRALLHRDRRDQRVAPCIGT